MFRTYQGEQNETSPICFSFPFRRMPDAGGEDNNRSRKEGQVKKRKVNWKLRLRGPGVLMKNTLLREAQEQAQAHEILQREFLALPKKIKNEEVKLPFVFS